MDQQVPEDMSIDLKNDILLAFNGFKNENNKINKLKLRTLLFSFVMYKTNAKDINEYIEEETNPDQELFDYEEVCSMVYNRLKPAKEKESDEVFNYIVDNKNENAISEKEIIKAFDKKIDASPDEIREMMRYIIGNDSSTSVKGPLKISREQFKKFYTDSK